jgi:ketosteroid isomerase-like protein
MRTTFVRLSLVILCLAVAGSQVWAAGDLEKLEKQIEETSDKIVRATIEGDLETLFSYYVDDAVSLPNYGTMLKGIEALKKNEEEMRKAGVKIHSLDFTTLDL